MSVSGLAVRAGTAYRLGLLNILRVLRYRLACQFGLGAAALRSEPIADGAFFGPVGAPRGRVPVPAPALPLAYFGWKRVDGDDPPDWFLDPFTGRRFDGVDRPWHRLPDFGPAGDIKCVWEPSRWDWLLHFAQQARHASVPGPWVDRIDTWLRSWLRSNPAYFGPNWKCAQEASIRVLHLAVAALLLEQVDRPSKALQGLARLHLRRIVPTLAYAMAQDNNHGTSEAAALFVGGSWLAAHGDAEAGAWAASGRRWLENRVDRLVMPDGSFSQYSVNYHRLMLDTLSVCEVWRRALRLAPFTAAFAERAAQATLWLRYMVQADSGDAPNLGANDGANLLPLTSADYRDYRPSVQLAAALFLSAQAFPEGPWDAQLAWLGVAPAASRLPAVSSRLLADGGFAVLRRGRAAAYLRCPAFRFRPSQADGLHVDLWVGGENWLRDGGSYTYGSAEEMAYYGGTASHNTVQFDGRDQMPRLSRFLFGAWLDTRTEAITEALDHVHVAAQYRDWRGASHRRSVTLHDGRLVVRDEIAGFHEGAVLRWRLAPAAWSLDGNRVSGGAFSMTVTADAAVQPELRLAEGRESRYYHQASPLPVVEFATRRPGTLTTVVEWR